MQRAHEEALAIAAAARNLAAASLVTEAQAATAIVTTIVAFERADEHTEVCR
jgi:hypothetical protein